jgi:cystathionine gamma-synthase
LRLETLCVHAGSAPDAATGAVAPPIHLSTTFERDIDGEFSRGFKYARDLNPTRRTLEEAMATIEGGAAALAFSSGQAATAAVFQSLRPGDHALLPQSAYYGTPKLAQELFVPWGLSASTVAMNDLVAVRAAIRDETRLVWIETPSNPLLTITDIAGVVAIAREVGARVVVDNTWATPVGQRPLELGADIVMHASTKYLGGHSDVLGGILVARHDDESFGRIRQVQQVAGSVAAPFDAWLVRRGLRTLFGAMASVQVRGGRAEAMGVAARCRVFTRATSLGGVESLVEHRASVEGPETSTPENLLRLSIGLEHHDDLIDDLTAALAAI